MRGKVDRKSHKRVAYYLVHITLSLAALALSSSAQDARGAANPFSKGEADAKFQIEVFYDFQCPSCASFHPILRKIEEKHGDNVRIVVRHFPLPIHDKAYEAALAVEAAGMQGKFWEMSDLLLTNQTRWANSKDFHVRFIRYAKMLDLDIERFNQDRAGIAARGRVNLDIQRGKSVEINSVPSVILNGKLLSYAEASELDKIISRGK